MRKAEVAMVISLPPVSGNDGLLLLWFMGLTWFQCPQNRTNSVREELGACSCSLSSLLFDWLVAGCAASAGSSVLMVVGCDWSSTGPIPSSLHVWCRLWIRAAVIHYFSNRVFYLLFRIINRIRNLLRDFFYLTLILQKCICNILFLLKLLKIKLRSGVK